MTLASITSMADLATPFGFYIFFYENPALLVVLVLAASLIRGSNL